MAVEPLSEGKGGWHGVTMFPDLCSHMGSHSRSETVPRCISSSVDRHGRPVPAGGLCDGQQGDGWFPGLGQVWKSILFQRMSTPSPGYILLLFCILHWLPRCMAVFSLYRRQCVHWHQ